VKVFRRLDIPWLSLKGDFGSWGGIEGGLGRMGKVGRVVKGLVGEMNCRIPL
jgi:hypothetical protein